MITVDLYGRTGNNMFQIAAAIAVAKRLGTQPYYVGDDSHLNGLKLKGISKIQKKCSKSFVEKMFNYDNSIEALTDNTHLDGYFQSEKYFLPAEDEVRRCFSFDTNTVESAKKIHDGKYKCFFDGNLNTAIHIRRTDYLKYPDVYPQYGLDYYDTCLAKMGDIGRILVFSDDIGWCRNIFNGRDYTMVELPPLPSMYLMSKCKNVIMANSSFSWWASWLGRAEKVFYPQNWFGNRWPHKDIHSTHEECIKDLCPSRWNKA